MGNTDFSSLKFVVTNLAHHKLFHALQIKSLRYVRKIDLGLFV